MRLHALIFENNGWHVAQCLEIDLASQGNTQEEALLNLAEALTLHFQLPVNSTVSSIRADSGAFDLSSAQSELSILELDVSLDVGIVPGNLMPKISLQERLERCQAGESFSFRQTRFKLEAKGFDEVRQLNNHAKFVKRESGRISTAILPHYLQLSPCVLSSILNQAQISEEEFAKL